MFSNGNKSLVKCIEDCIRDWHPDLAGARFAALFNDKESTSGGKVVVGKAVTVSEGSVWKPLLARDADFIIWVVEDVWAGMSPSDRVPFIDTILCGCRYDEEKGKASIVAPDFEGYYAAVRRHGIWNDMLEGIVQAKTENTFVQSRLFDVEPSVFDDALSDKEQV